MVNQFLSDVSFKIGFEKAAKERSSARQNSMYFLVMI
jgi:hypothetical protein